MNDMYVPKHVILLHVSAFMINMYLEPSFLASVSILS